MKILITTALLLAIALPAAAEREDRSYGNVCTAEPGSSLSLRRGPGRNFRVLTQIRDGSSVVLFNSQYGRDGFKWWLTNANGRQGWVRSDYVCMDGNGN